jgi:hypothetical protein
LFPPLSQLQKRRPENAGYCVSGNTRCEGRRFGDREHSDRSAAASLIAGLHRLEAAKKLGWRTIRSVYTEDHSAGLLRLMEIDENLMRADLCRQRSERRISTNGNRSTRLNFQRPDWMPAGRGRPKQVGQNEQPIARYTREAATKTGSSETTVKREVARGKSNPRYRVDCRDVA